MVSPVDLCVMACDAIGSTGVINGINPPVPANSLAAQVASRNYQQQVDAIFRAANWGCLRRQIELTTLKAAAGTPENPDGSLPQPPFPWLYEYAYPTDCIRMRFVMPKPDQPLSGVPQMTNLGLQRVLFASARAPFTPATDVDADGNDIKVILTNVRAAYGIYSKRVQSPDLWEPELRGAIIAALAATFVNPLARNAQLMNERTQMAARLLIDARVADANEGTTSTDSEPDWMKARYAGIGLFPWQGAVDGVASAYGWFDPWLGPDGVYY